MSLWANSAVNTASTIIAVRVSGIMIQQERQPTLQPSSTDASTSWFSRLI